MDFYQTSGSRKPELIIIFRYDIVVIFPRKIESFSKHDILFSVLEDEQKSNISYLEILTFII